MPNDFYTKENNQQPLSESLLELSKKAVDDMNITPALKEEFKRRLDEAVYGVNDDEY